MSQGNEFADGRSRRRYVRVHGPFDGWRVGLLDVPVRIYDLSLGGCFVNATHAQRDGARLVLKIDLPSEGSITVHAESIYHRAGGYAVRFIDLDADAAARVARTVEALKDLQTAKT